jgi:hypothetical protein
LSGGDVETTIQLSAMRLESGRVYQIRPRLFHALRLAIASGDLLVPPAFLPLSGHRNGEVE